MSLCTGSWDSTVRYLEASEYHVCVADTCSSSAFGREDWYDSIFQHLLRNDCFGRVIGKCRPSRAKRTFPFSVSRSCPEPRRWRSFIVLSDETYATPNFAFLVTHTTEALLTTNPKWASSASSLFEEARKVTTRSLGKTKHLY